MQPAGGLQGDPAVGDELRVLDFHEPPGRCGMDHFLGVDQGQASAVDLDRRGVEHEAGLADQAAQGLHRAGPQVPVVRGVEQIDFLAVEGDVGRLRLSRDVDDRIDHQRRLAGHGLPGRGPPVRLGPPVLAPEVGEVVRVGEEADPLAEDDGVVDEGLASLDRARRLGADAFAQRGGRVGVRPGRDAAVQPRHDVRESDQGAGSFAHNLFTWQSPRAIASAASVGGVSFSPRVATTMRWTSSLGAWPFPVAAFLTWAGA